MRYRNPILRGFYPDPSICRKGEDYYLVTSSFEYWPAVPIFHSKDLIHWRQIGHCLTRHSQLQLQDLYGPHGIFAPTLRYHNGLFYMITTDVRGQGHFYVTAKEPADQWSDPVFIEGDGFDPDLFFDDDGKVYYSYHPSDGNIKQCEIDLHTGVKLSEEIVIWEGYEDKYCEGPHLYKINGSYYLLAAEGETYHGHMAVIAKGPSPSGPFLSCPHNPILTHRSLGWTAIQSIGHADLIQSHHGTWWLVFLGVRRIGWGNHHLGRETFIAPVQWTEDGWPMVNQGEPIALTMEVAEDYELHPWPAEPTRDDFNHRELPLHWNTLRNPMGQPLWSLTRRPGWLSIQGEAPTLSDIAFHSFVGRRQQHFQCRCEAWCEFVPSRDGEEAGLTVRMNERFHYEISITQQAGKRGILLRKRVADLTVEQFEEIQSTMAVVLRIMAAAEGYQFSYREGTTGEWHMAGTGESLLLSQEVAGGFTGVYAGMYATGNGRSCEQPAHFDWFEYEGLDE
ncbi:glycoside hydrolase family 43 protein [Paenibacillus sp. GCM10023252]|uniref:glycoside hydrolase family 43 protein n=1 Tax=Paenibacillus sp. GCM10023252 TaxID=3252649 RepID=UPI003608AF39